MKNELTGRRILVVEDEMLLRMTIEDALSDVGCQVTVAATIDGADIILSERAFDAAVLDLDIRGESCRVLANTLLGMGVPFVFATGSSDSLEGHEGRTILRKPYQFNDLMSALAACCGSTRTCMNVAVDPFT